MVVSTRPDRGKVPPDVGAEGSRGEQRSLAEATQALRGCKLFRDLNDEQIRAMAGAFRIERYAVGEAIFKQGDLGEKIFLIEEGQVTLERNVNLGGREGRTSLSLLGKCRILGCWACLLGERRHYTESAVCQKPTQVLSAEGRDLEAIMKENQQIAVVLLKRLSFMLGDKLHDCYCAMGTL